MAATVLPDLELRRSVRLYDQCFLSHTLLLIGVCVEPSEPSIACLADIFGIAFLKVPQELPCILLVILPNLDLHRSNCRVEPKSQVASSKQILQPLTFHEVLNPGILQNGPPYRHGNWIPCCGNGYQFRMLRVWPDFPYQSNPAIGALGESLSVSGSTSRLRYGAFFPCSEMRSTVLPAACGSTYSVGDALTSSERHAQFSQQLRAFLVGLRRGHQSDVHTVDLLYLVKVDLGEYDLFLEAEGVVPSSVE